MAPPEICKIKDLRAIRGSLEQNPLRYLDLLRCLEEPFPYEVYVDQPEVPNRFLTVVNYGKGYRAVQVESSSPSWARTAFGHVPLGEPVEEWTVCVTNSAVMPVVEEIWEGQWKEYMDLVCTQVPPPVQTHAAVRPLESDDVTALADSLADDASPDHVIGRYTSRLTSPETVCYGAFVDNKLVAWVLTSPTIPQVWDVEFIYTHPAWRGRGYASVVAAAYAADILRQGKIPYYSSPANEASRCAAERAGFVVYRTRLCLVSANVK